MKLQLQFGLFLVLLVCSSNMGQAIRSLENVNLIAHHCSLSSSVWNITKPVDKERVEWVDIGVRNTCKYCDAKDVHLGLETVLLTHDKLLLDKPLPASEDQIVRHQTRDSVVNKVQVFRADFFNCRA